MQIAFLRSVGANIPHFQLLASLFTLLLSYPAMLMKSQAGDLTLTWFFFLHLDPTFYAQQLLVILLFNWIQHTKPDIKQQILSLSTHPIDVWLILTQDDIVKLPVISDFQTLSIQQNILTS